MRWANDFTSAFSAVCIARFPICTSAIPAMPAVVTHSLSVGVTGLDVPPVAPVVVGSLVAVEGDCDVPVVSVLGSPSVVSDLQARNVNNNSAATAAVIREVITTSPFAVECAGIMRADRRHSRY